MTSFPGTKHAGPETPRRGAPVLADWAAAPWPRAEAGPGPARPMQAEPASAEALLAFGGAVKERFGLGQLLNSRTGLEHRLREALARTGFQGSTLEFARALSRAGDDDPLTIAAAEALINRETRFFRDADQLCALVHALVPPRVARLAPGAPLRVLSAGCATGEEAYSLAILLLEDLHRLWGHTIEVVGVDLSAQAIARARSGVFPASAVERACGGPPDWDQRYFRRVGNELRARDHLRAALRFERANLMSPASLEPLGRFDLVVCRNVLIYFDGETLVRAVENLRARLAPGGALVLGYAETGAAAARVPAQRRSGDVFWFAPREAC